MAVMGRRMVNFSPPIKIDAIGLARTSFDHLAKSQQDRVSFDMTASVIEFFEIVEIKKQQGQRLSVSARTIALHLRLHPLAISNVDRVTGQ